MLSGDPSYCNVANFEDAWIFTKKKIYTGVPKKEDESMAALLIGVF
jgi:hypothetical protein